MASIFVLYTLVFHRLTILMSTHFSTSLGNLMFLQSNKNSSHLVFIGHDLHPLVLSVKDRRKRPEGGGVNGSQSKFLKKTWPMFQN
jgi:hypothetical protein